MTDKPFSESRALGQSRALLEERSGSSDSPPRAVRSEPMFDKTVDTEPAPASRSAASLGPAVPRPGAMPSALTWLGLMLFALVAAFIALR